MTQPNLEKKKPTILVLPRWYPNRFDIQLGTFIQQQALLMKDDYHMIVIYVQADPTLRQKFEIHENHDKGISEYIVYFQSGTGIWGKFRNMLRYKKAQDLAYQKIRTDVSLCHVHVPYRSAFLALDLRKHKKIPMVITEHWSGHLNGQYLQKNSSDKMIYKDVLKKASGITVVSELLSNHFKFNTGFESEVIPNLISIEEEQGKPEVMRPTTEFIEILSVSDMIDSVKNITGLIRAFNESIKQHPALRLTLIGGGPDEGSVQKLILDLGLQNSIRHLGRQPHKLVLNEMSRCHFYVCNSNFETFGMTVAEAIRSGKPVICTRCGGPEEFLHEQNSILINKSNTDELVSALTKMSTTYTMYNPSAMAADMEKRFGRETVRHRWTKFYEQHRLKA